MREGMISIIRWY